MSKPNATLPEFIEQFTVKMETARVDQRPDKLMSETRDMRHWRCVLRCGPRRMTVYFSQGSAHTEAPTLAEVLDSLASDSSSWENARSFEDWAGEYGYDPDSRAAERTFNLIQKQAEGLAHLLTDHGYQALLWHTERL